MSTILDDSLHIKACRWNVIHKDVKCGAIVKSKFESREFVMERLCKHIKGWSGIQQGLFLTSKACFFQVSAHVDEMKEM